MIAQSEVCEHEDYTVDLDTEIACCDACGHNWPASGRQMELQRQENERRRYWDRVDEGRQRAKDGEK